MKKVRVDEHIREMEQFLKQSEHLRTVLHNFEDLNTVDRNDLYEIVYSKKAIEKWLKQDIQNDSIKKSLEELLESINLIVGSLSGSILKKIVEHPLNGGKSVEELNKLKYGNKTQYKGLEDKTKVIRERQRSIVQKYLVKKIVPLMMISIVYLLIASGKLTDISKDTAEKTLDVVETIMTENNTNEESAQDIVENDEMHGELNTSLFTSGVSTLISVIAMMIMCTLSLTICMDLLYISMPIVREMAEDKHWRLISSEAYEIVRLQAYEPFIREHKVIDYRDRFEVALALLHNTEAYMDEFYKLHMIYNKNNKVRDRIEKSWKEVHKVIQEIKSRVESNDIIVKVDALVDAEFMYENNKDKIDTDLVDKADEAGLLTCEV